MAPLATSATNVFANIIESKNKQRAKESMIKNADVNLARISPQKLDLGRERSSIRGERDLVAASGRRRSQGASSAAERANIENAARIASQRVAGRQLGDSYGREEAANLDARQKADMFNVQQSSREAELTNKNKMMAERMYGSPGGLDWLPGSLRSTGKNFSNAAQEFQKNQLLYKQLGLMNENYMVDQDGNTVLRKKQK